MSEAHGSSPAEGRQVSDAKRRQASSAKRPRSFAVPLKPFVFALCLLPASVLALHTYQIVSGTAELTDLGANPITEIEIQTGLWTLRFLAITLAITPVREISGLGALGKYRRMFGLFTFFYACLHVGTWVGVDWFFDWAAMGDEIVKHKYILVGMFTFLLLIPLALTSTKGWIRRLGGKRWIKLHRLVYLAAVGGTVHYLWAVKKDTLFPVFYLGLFSVLLGYRLVKRYRMTSARSQGAVGLGRNGSSRTR